MRRFDLFALGQTRRERGQSIVLFTLILTGLIGVGGLLLDGGLAWSNRRAAQSAADSAALAAAKAAVYGNDISAAANSTAAANGFPSGSVSCPGGSTSQGVVINRPPVLTTNAALRTTDYVEVVVTRRQDNTLSAMIPGQGCWIVSARAVAYAKMQPAGSSSGPSSVYAPAVLGGAHGCHDHSTITWGGQNVTVNGNIFSNGGNDWSGSGTVGGTWSWVQTPPDPSCLANTFNQHGNVATVVTTQTYTPYPAPYVNYTYTSLCAPEPGKVVFDIGSNPNIDTNPAYLISNNPPTLRDGVYCATGKNGDFQGGSITLSSTGTTGHVTLVAQQVTLNTVGARLFPYYPVASPSLTIYAFGTGSSTINWKGTDALWQGIIFAPNGNIHITGAGSGVAGSIWGDSIDFTGKDTTLNPVLVPGPAGTPSASAAPTYVVRLVE